MYLIVINSCLIVRISNVYRALPVYQAVLYLYYSFDHHSSFVR